MGPGGKIPAQACRQGCRLALSADSDQVHLDAVLVWSDGPVTISVVLIYPRVNLRA